MNKLRLLAFGAVLTAITATVAHAQFPEINAKEVRSLMGSGRNVVLIDTRTPGEYEAGHIPGAINIPADRLKAERSRLPRDRSTQLIFYCRGVG